MQPDREKVLVLGANGKVGKQLVKYLIKHYHVIALIRGAPKYGINSPHLEFTQGDVFDDSVLHPLVKNAKMVASALKPSPPHSVKDYTQRLIESIKANGSPRLIVVGSLGSLRDKTGEAYVKDLPSFPKEMKEASEEHTVALNELRNSGIEFTVVCPPAITDGMDDEGAVTCSEKAPQEVGYTLKGGNLGNWVLEEMKNHAHTKEAVGVWDK